ncbi:hypothetical protein OJ598_03165 [Streptococcus anginosus]|jgi:conserved hypothetical protein|uniref:Uncharacterized protein n=1 Tax=Streptococcus intermedius TaxID=1338 RepID=A0A930RB40_STRIT|nr:hypothetical protein [Streptococcus anginosus]MBF1712397.1 hypothetical protein [Streptococcus intermedius]MCW0924653.1 hypothetical protein [Streptococcus anginosus]
MTPEIINAVVTISVSFIGTFGGIVTSAKLTTFRIQELEKKVEKHNSVVERTYRLEERTNYFDERIDKLESKIEKEK